MWCSQGLISRQLSPVWVAQPVVKAEMLGDHLQTALPGRTTEIYESLAETVQCLDITIFSVHQSLYLDKALVSFMAMSRY
jgi:hypothetical protein